MQSIFFEKNKLSFIALVIIPILVVIIYGQTLNFSYNIDDEYYINQLPEQNTTFFEKLASINQPFNQSDFRPVTYTTFLIESTFFGKSAKVFHLFNLIYYSILCFTIFLIFQFIFRTAKIELASYIALLIAVLFLLHPSHANVVASIKNRESILSLSFALWALYFWIHFLKQTKPIRLVYFFLCIGILLLSIFAKVESIVFLLILPVTGYFIVPYFFDRRKVFATLISVAVFFIVCLVLVFIIKDIPNYQLDNASIVTADESPIDFTTSMIKRWAVTFHTFFMYEMFMIYPKGYYFYFGYDTIDLWTYKNIWPYLFGVIHLVFLIFLIALTKKRNIYALGPLIFFIAIFPFLNLFISVAGIVAVRYSFIASLGFCMALAQLIFCLYSRLKKYNIGKPVIAITTLSILILYGYFSRQRAQVWKDRVTLFNHDLPYLEKSVVANRMACTYYIDKYVNDKDWKNEQTLKKVIEYADNALKVYNTETHVLQTKAKALGFLNQHNEAHALLRQSVKIDSTEIRGLSLLASHAAFLGYNKEAIKSYEQILKIDSSQTQPYTELSILYAFQGAFEKAQQLNNYLFENNLPANAYLNLGNIALIEGDTLEAVHYIIEVLKRDSSEKSLHLFDMVTEYAHQKNNDSLKNVLKAFNFRKQ